MCYFLASKCGYSETTASEARIGRHANTDQSWKEVRDILSREPDLHVLCNLAVASVSAMSGYHLPALTRLVTLTQTLTVYSDWVLVQQSIKCSEAHGQHTQNAIAQAGFDIQAYQCF